MSSLADIKSIIEDGDYDYKWSVVGGDDPDKRNNDSDLINRREGYEIVDLIDDVIDNLNAPVSEELVYGIEDDIHKKYGKTRSRDDLLDALTIDYTAREFEKGFNK
ncbi:MAG: hypothetical protein AB7D57_06010 [Desulfovibrionaceae bacterium]